MDIAYLGKTMIFKGMNDAEITAALSALQASEKNYRKGTRILHAGTFTDRTGLVLSGSVTIEINDVWGNRTILSHVKTGEFFAETYAFLVREPLMVDVVANENCRILFLKTGSIDNYSAAPEKWRYKLLNNLLTISSHKNLALSARSFHTSPKTIRSRIMAYLNTVSLKTGTNEFDIPFDRQQLADYLNVERTALSKELGRMQKEEIIHFRKNHFIIL